jgi:hypothetical protein
MTSPHPYCRRNRNDEREASVTRNWGYLRLPHRRARGRRRGDGTRHAGAARLSHALNNLTHPDVPRPSPNATPCVGLPSAIMRRFCLGPRRAMGRPTCDPRDTPRLARPWPRPLRQPACQPRRGGRHHGSAPRETRLRWTASRARSSRAARRSLGSHRPRRRMDHRRSRGPPRRRTNSRGAPILSAICQAHMEAARFNASA